MAKKNSGAGIPVSPSTAGIPQTRQRGEATAFGRYKVLSRLGHGAMATVYLAEDPSLSRMVAIKVIHSHLANQTDLLTRFTSEAKTAASLRNPNIVEIFDYGLQEGHQYLVMEYIDGPNLQTVLNLMNGQPLDPILAVALVCQAAEGLSVAERKSVVHRDIKPENMMLNSEGLLKIADFGIAHINEQNLTKTGSLLGSPNYMAPEQVDGRKPSHATDMFALGAVFYFALTGRKPFSGPNIPSIFRAICDLPHIPVTDSLPEVDPELVILVDTLLAKEPEQRGQGARWLAQKLRAWLNGKGVHDLPGYVRQFLETIEAGDRTIVESPVSPQVKPVEEAPKIKPGRAPVPPLSLQNSGEADLQSLEQTPDLTLAPAVSESPFLPLKSEKEAFAFKNPEEKSKPTLVPKRPAALLESSQKFSFKKSPGLLLGLVGVLAILVGLILGVIIKSETHSSKAIETKGAEVTPVLPDTRVVSPTPVTVITPSDSSRVAAIPTATPPETKPLAPSHSEANTVAVSHPQEALPTTTEVTFISSPPFAEVFVDGRFLGNTPLKGKKVLTGKHKVLLNHRRFPSLDTVVRLTEGQNTTLRFHFSNPAP